MIRKFIAIDNVGRFHEYRPSGDIEFRQCNLIFAENGSGKTTLASIIRSLQEQTATYIDERVTTGATAQPTVRLLAEGSNITFRAGAWDGTGPSCVIFDSHFVNSHVYAGHYMDGSHRKELYRFVLGAEQVNLAKSLDELDAQLRPVRKGITDLTKAIESHSSGLSVKEFTELSPIADLDAQIEAASQKVAAQKESQKLQNRPRLREIDLPLFDSEGFSNLLGQSVDSVAADAEQLINAHIQSHLDTHGESWLREGRQYMRHGQSCPFCGQSLVGSSLAAAYTMYFSAEYKQLLEAIRRYEAQSQTAFSDRLLRDIENAIQTNRQQVEFWHQYIPVELADLQSEDVRSPWEELFREISGAIRDKQSDPLTAKGMSSDLLRSLDQYEKLLEKVGCYNRQVQSCNRAIDEQKASLAGGSVDAMEMELKNLERVQHRYQSEVVALCAELDTLQAEKEYLEDQQQRMRLDLENSESELLTRYQQQLNRYLENFGTEFRVEEYRRVNTGGTPRSAFRLHVNDESVDIGAADTVGKPCFRTLLSEGDKSSLAFAFFIAKLDTEPALADKIVIIDDPITSLDWYRRARTLAIIARLREKVQQLIILSHDDLFLRKIFYHGSIPHAGTRLLYLRKIGKTSKIEEWNLDEVCGNVYLQNCRTVQRFIEEDEGNPVDVVKCLRPMLEENLRIRFVGIFRQHEWLGDFLTAIRDAQPNDLLYPLQNEIYDTLSEINDYTAPYHHGDGTGGRTPDTAELKSYARQTLQVMHGLPVQ